jgi:hypothetical protein
MQEKNKVALCLHRSDICSARYFKSRVADDADEAGRALGAAANESSVEQSTDL